jgi:hypothetical protein
VSGTATCQSTPQDWRPLSTITRQDGPGTTQLSVGHQTGYPAACWQQVTCACKKSTHHSPLQIFAVHLTFPSIWRVPLDVVEPPHHLLRRDA